MAWSDTGRKTETNATTTPSTLTLTLNSTAAHSMVLLGVVSDGSSSAPTFTVSDDVNGSWSEAATRVQGTTRTSIHYFKDNAGGNLTISIARSPANWIWTGVHEFAGGGANVAISGSAVVNGGTNNSANPQGTGTVSPADNDVLVVALLQFSFTGTLTENAGGEGFTLSNEFEDTGGGGGQPGSLVFKIISGAPGTPSHSWNVGTGRTWATNIVAFKPEPAGAARKIILSRPA